MKIRNVTKASLAFPVEVKNRVKINDTELSHCMKTTMHQTKQTNK